MAIKVLEKRKLKDITGRENVEKVLEEVAILHQLDHPNIVKYLETYKDQKYMYLVMEHIGGRELFAKITEQKNFHLSEEMAKGYLKKLLGACHHMHSQGIVHRDLKPENIMLT